MTQTLLLRIIMAAIGSFILFAAIFSLPFAALPMAYIGLTFGITQAGLVAVGAIALTALLMAPSLAIIFTIMFLAPTLVLVRQALLSRAMDDGTYEFFPLEKLIVLALAMTGIGTLLIFSLFGGEAGMPQNFATSIANTPELRQVLGQMYDLSTPEAALQVANLIIISGFASWPLLLLGNLQIAQALAIKLGRNLRPAGDYTTLTLPIWLIPVLLVCLATSSVTGGWVATMAATLSGMVLVAYFLLGLAIIHAISRPWNARGLFLATLYFLLFVMAWVIIPIALMGLLDARFDFRKLTKSPDKPSDTQGDEE